MQAKEPRLVQEYPGVRAKRLASGEQYLLQVTNDRVRLPSFFFLPFPAPHSLTSYLLLYYRLLNTPAPRWPYLHPCQTKLRPTTQSLGDQQA
jgi:hypothetical protein